MPQILRKGPAPPTTRLLVRRGQPDASDFLDFVAARTLNSVILAVIFGLIVTRLAPPAAGTIGLGMAWGVAVFAMMWFTVKPAIDPLMLNVNAAVFFAAHLMWGAALGFIWTRYGRSPSELSFAR